MVRASGFLFLSTLVGASVASLPAYGSARGRVLRAATRRSDLFRRSMRIEKKFGAELSFVEGKLLPIIAIS
jgi:hypothetical protein